MRTLTITLMSMAAVAVSGCAVTTAGVKKGDERNFARSFNDVSAGRAIKARLSRAEGFKLGKVDVEVAEGIAVLTGNVPTAEDRVEAERIAWSAANVDQVGNELLVQGGPGLVRKTKDSVLGTSIRTRLIAEKSVKARNVNIEAYNGIVYLLGVARTPQELEKIAEIASTTKGTREVVSYIKLAGADVMTANYATPSGQPQYIEPQPHYPQTGVAPQTLRPLPQGLTQAPTDLGVELGAGPLQQAEPYYVDPQTGKRITLPPGTKTIPLGSTPPGAFPSDGQLGQYRSGPAGEAVSVIESEPYYIDPETGKKIPVSHLMSGR